MSDKPAPIRKRHQIRPPRVQQLDEAQRVAFVKAVQDRYLSTFLFQSPPDKAAAERSLRAIYRQQHVDPPETILWVGSPLVGAITAALFDRAYEIVGDPFWDKVCNFPNDNGVPDLVSDEVFSDACNLARKTLEPLVATTTEQRSIRGADRTPHDFFQRLNGSIGFVVQSHARQRSIWCEVVQQARAHLGPRVPDLSDHVSVRHQWRQAGSSFEHWQTALVCAILEEICGRATPWQSAARLIQSCGWWWGFEKAAVLALPLAQISYDENIRLHNDSGPAVEAVDGWKAYVLQGVQVPENVVVAPETITAEQIEAEVDAEVRRLMVDLFGAEKYLRSGNAQLVDTSDYGKLWLKEVSQPANPDLPPLLRARLAEVEPIMMVEVLNSTPELDGSFKRYFLRVPPRMQTAREALAWTFGLEESAYILKHET